MKKLSVIATLLIVVISIFGEVMPYQNKLTPVTYRKSRPSEKYFTTDIKRGRELPEKSLVVLVQFSDVQFDLVADYPDSLAHDQAYFERYMLQLEDYLFDASHEQYELDYDFHTQVVTLDKPMSYYGSDDDTDTRMPEMMETIVNQIDEDTDFTQYDNFFIFHAGPGQESDIDEKRKEQIWSTFINRYDLQEGLDPDNDDFLGIPADGTHVTDFIICAESQWQDYFPDDNPAYILGNLGVICTEFFYALGVPNLSDRDYSNGYSQGIGNWGIMGSGTWNASGYTPALPSAWTRYYLGWEDPVEIVNTTSNIEIDQILDSTPTNPILYKLSISENEYFLIENRAQNPDNSSLNNVANFTFKLLQEGQEYYPLAEGQTEQVPKFNFMTNRLRGCEWDFFLPGYSGGGYNPRDGSGLLIWHIDETVIADNFDIEEDISNVNGDASHKGIDLEEADGIQNLDTGVSSIYKYGSPEDSFRQGNNNYFGFDYVDGILSLPSAESYYGGFPFVIKDISEAGNTMSFSVEFRWQLAVADIERSDYSSMSLDINQDGSNEIIFPVEDKLAVYSNLDDPSKVYQPLKMMKEEDGTLYDMIGDIKYPPSYDKINNNLLIPTQVRAFNSRSYLYRFNENGLEEISELDNKYFTSPIVMHQIDEDSEMRYYMGIYDASDSSGKIRIHDSSCSYMTSFPLSGRIKSNLLCADYLMAIVQNDGYKLELIDYETGESDIVDLAIPADTLIKNSLYFDFNPNYQGLELVVQTRYGFYSYTSTDFSKIGYFETGVESSAKPSITDFDSNGTWDIVLGYNQGLKVLAFNGEEVSNDRFLFMETDTLSTFGGAYALDIDFDEEKELIGGFSMNRASIWNNDGSYYPGAPISYPDFIHSYPSLHLEGDKLYLLTAVDGGTINRLQVNSNVNQEDFDVLQTAWFTEYNNYQRNAVELNDTLPNSYETEDIFIDDEVYIYPSPWNTTIGGDLTLKVMVSEKCNVGLEVFTISGKKVYQDSRELDPYVGNQTKFYLPIEKLSSGVYFARIKAQGEYKQIKFAIEK